MVAIASTLLMHLRNETEQDKVNKTSQKACPWHNLSQRMAKLQNVRRKRKNLPNSDAGSLIFLPSPPSSPWPALEQAKTRRKTTRKREES